MSKEVAKKKFQRGLLGIIFGYGFLGFLVTCFCVTRVEPNSIHHVCREVGGWSYRDALELRGDLYVVASHNLPAGTLLSDKNIKIVVMPTLKGYETAFSDAEEVIGRSTAHAVPEGQPVLPYHMSERRTADNLLFDKE